MIVALFSRRACLYRAVCLGFLLIIGNGCSSVAKARNDASDALVLTSSAEDYVEQPDPTGQLSTETNPERDPDTRSGIETTLAVSDAGFAADATTFNAENHSANNEDLWRVMREHMQLAHRTDQRRVKQELAWLNRNPEYFPRLQARLQRYLPYILKKTLERGMPAEIALLPIVESALDPYAFSPGGASGVWQFLRPTAIQYGVNINAWYDGRRDVVAATDAALDFLTYLHKKFGHWELALAAYNAGEGRVARALRKSPVADFFDLSLPRETRAYVPRLLALSAWVKNPQAYATTLPEIRNEPQFAVLPLGSQFDLNVLSKTLAMPLPLIYNNNPGLSRWATSPTGPHHLIIPIATESPAPLGKEQPIASPLPKMQKANGKMSVAALQAKLAEVPERARLNWQEVVIHSGDTLSQIAQMYGTSLKTLKRFNGLRSSRIRVGQKILVPTHNPKTLSAAYRKRHAGPIYRVRKGDSLWLIARRTGTRLNDLMRMNGIGPRDLIRPGQTLRLAEETAQAEVAIRVATNAVLPAATQPRELRPEVTRTIHYTVRRGDSLSRIAGKFAVGATEIAAWNNLNIDKYLFPGQSLTLYVNVLCAGSGSC